MASRLPPFSSGSTVAPLDGVPVDIMNSSPRSVSSAVAPSGSSSKLTLKSTVAADTGRSMLMLSKTHAIVKIVTIRFIKTPS